jgi:hypothetical protein
MLSHGLMKDARNDQLLILTPSGADGQGCFQLISYS